MEKEKKAMSMEELHDLSLEQKREIDSLPAQMKKRIDKLEKENREEIRQKISGLSNLDDATKFDEYPELIKDWLKKDIHGILGITYEDLSADMNGEKFLSNLLRFFIFKLNSLI